jgi:protein-tyrosine phosphatase
MSVSHILDRFWVGAHLWGEDPPASVQCLVLCANELKLPPDQYLGWTLRDGGFEDHQTMRENLMAAEKLSARAIQWMVAHPTGDVLFTCFAGFNRSALTMGLTAKAMLGLPGVQIADAIRAQRPEALNNEMFYQYLIR